MNNLQTSVPTNISTMETGEAPNSTDGSVSPIEVPTEDWIVAVVPVCILVFTVLGIVFNLFVLMVFFLHKKACTVPEIYLSNLAVADLVLLACLPFWAVYLSNNYNWIFGPVLCRLVNLGINMNMYCSIYFLVLVSIDRYVALVHPMSHNRMRRPKYARLGCLVVWGFGLLMGVPTLIYREVKTDLNPSSCKLNYPDGTFALFEGLHISFSFIIPIIIISCCTFKIIKALHNRLLEQSHSQNVEHKATTLVLAVLLAFVICWMPFNVLRIVELLERSKLLKINLRILDTCSNIFVYLGFFNSVLNPLLYVIVGKNFRKKVHEVFKRRGGEAFFDTTSIRSILSRSFKLVNFSNSAA